LYSGLLNDAVSVVELIDVQYGKRKTV